MAIRTTHVGSLPRPKELLDANARRAEIGEDEFARILQDSVDEVVRRQHAIGIDVVNDGEYGHIMTESVDYGAWWFYSFSRFGGLELTTDQRFDMAPPAAGGKSSPPAPASPGGAAPSTATRVATPAVSPAGSDCRPRSAPCTG